jgi:hypothetical protein
MKGSVAVVGVAVILILAIAFGSTLYPQGRTSNQTTGVPTATTVGQIISGEFPSGLDKQGTGGVLVTVLNLTVLYVHDESDGDWHVAVTDGNVSVFITEIIPRDQAVLGRPVAGSVIDETGVPFCDVQHENESWHGDTCWEIHPVTAWSLSA